MPEKVTLVTGASQGIGRAVAELLATEGVRAVLCARGQEALDEAVAAIRSGRREA